MALSSTTSRVSFAGNGSTTAFSFPYYFLADADLVVILKASVGTETTKTLTTHYTVTGAGVTAGGTVTMLTAPASGETLTIYRDPAATQDLDLVENDPLPAEELEERLDKVTMLSQRLKDRVDRAVRLTDGYSATFDTKLPTTLTADCVLAINPGGTGLVLGPTITVIGTAAASATAAAASASAAASSASAASTSASASASSASASAASAVTAAFYAANVTGLTVYANDAAFVSAVGAATNGKLYYNSTLHKIRVYQNGAWTSLGGGGGGGALQWVEAADSPISEIENNVQVYKFEDAVAQYLYALVKVPNEYSAGSQINLRMLMYSPSTSGTGLLKTLSTLLAKDSSAITSSTNQRTSTNSAVTFVTTANKVCSVTCDLTDSTGNINSVAVAAGDLIQVRLTRDTATDTDTADLRALVYGAEVTFS